MAKKKPVRRQYTLTVENLRLFRKPTTFRIAPITLLVGENSSGKTTALAAIYEMLVNHERSTEIPLNRIPFHLGGRSDLLPRKGAGRPKLSGRGELEDLGAVSLGVSMNEDGPSISGFGALISESSAGSLAYSRAWINSPGELLPRHYDPAEDAEALTFQQAMYLSTRPRGVEVFEQMYHSLNQVTRLQFRRGLAFAPMRARPRRTYDAASSQDDPEGEGFPHELRRQGEQHKQLPAYEAFRKLAKDAELFQDLKVKHLVRTGTPVFQVEVLLGGAWVNIVDVGYGVSQILPIAYRCAFASQPSLFLIQQPEVHLHPRGQAALGEFFGAMAHNGGHTFVIETHSDFLVDRVRYLIATGVLSKEDVSILFFRRKKREAEVGEVVLGDRGQVIDVPDGYREFFGEEMLRMFDKRI